MYQPEWLNNAWNPRRKQLRVCAMLKKRKESLLNDSRELADVNPLAKLHRSSKQRGGCGRSTFRAPGRRKMKNAAFRGFKQWGPPWDLQPWSLSLSIQPCWMGRAKNYAVWRATELLISLCWEVINSLNPWHQSYKPLTETARAFWKRSLADDFVHGWKLISTFCSEIISRLHSNCCAMWQNHTKNISHDS